MPPAQTQPIAGLSAPWWLLTAVALCLPVAAAVFWRVGRWWLSAEPVPLPEDRAMPAVRWPGWIGLAMFVILQLLMGAVVAGYHEAADFLPWEPLDVPGIFSPALFLAQALPPLVGLVMVRMFGRAALQALGVRTASFGTNMVRGLVTFAAILPVCFGALLANVLIMWLLRVPVEPHPLLETVEKIHAPWMLPAALVQAGVLAALAEEFIYRGILLVTLMKQVGVVWAVVGSSAVFALVHLPTEPQAILPLFFLGMALGYLAYRTRSLVGPVLAHALFNSLMVAGTFLGGT